MNRSIILALLVATTIAATPPSGGTAGQPLPPSEPGPPPVTGTTFSSGASAPTPNDAMLGRAKTAFAQLQSGTLDRSTLDEQMNAALTDDKVGAVKAAIGSLGTPVSFVEIRTGSQGGYPFAVYALTFANGTKMDLIFALDGQGKIAGMQLIPPQ
jgi:hypothetical protein